MIRHYYHHENDERQNREVDGNRDEAAVCEHGNACLLEIRQRHQIVGVVTEDDEEIAEIELADNCTNDRHDQIVHHRIDDFSECAADDYTDSEIDDVPLDCKLFELLGDAHMLFSLLIRLQ